MSYTMEPWEVSADINAELADRRRQLRNSSGTEPLPRPSLGRMFREACTVWYEWYDSPCHLARQQIYAVLYGRYDEEKMERWTPRIDAILDAAEAEVYAIVRDGCPLCRRHERGDETVGLAYETGPGRLVHSVVHGGGIRSSLRPCLSGHGETEEKGQ